MTSDWNGLIYKKLRDFRLGLIKEISTISGRVILSLRKIQYGNNIEFYGKTYFFRAQNSKIKLGNHVIFRSDETSNQIGIFRKCIISTLAKNAEIIIGDNTGLSGVAIGAANKIVIGANVLIGANCLITDTNWHNIDPLNRNLADPSPGEIVIGDNVFIGYGSAILKNVWIGDNSVIGAGSVVTKNIPDNVIAIGNPCKVIKSF